MGLATCAMRTPESGRLVGIERLHLARVRAVVNCWLTSRDELTAMIDRAAMIPRSMMSAALLLSA